LYNKNGFTLIELIAVIAIIGMLALIILPRIGGGSRQKLLLDTSTEILLSDLRLAQQLAWSENNTYHIYFDRFNKSYMIYSYRNMSNCLFKQVSLPGGISFDMIHSTYIDNKISFNGKGKPLPFPCTISLADSIGRYKRITITVGTDYISIKDK
jgi:prepilin-type N-terminal cleavage/methylation domain-containing protein